MKIKITLFILLFFSFLGNAQITYNFTALIGTYTANATPTVVFVAGVPATPPTNIISSPISIGFPFEFDCKPVTAFKVCVSGWMTTNTVITLGAFTNNLNIGPRLIIAPMWDVQATNGTTGQVNYAVTGVFPNRILTVEWKNMRWQFNTTTTPNVISYQVKLYETTNVIEFYYLQGPSPTFGAGVSASIGLTGALPGDFYSVANNTLAPTATKAIETSTINTKQAPGQIYSWTPFVCSGPPTAGTALSTPSANCSAYNSTISLIGNTVQCGLTYQWQSAPSSGGPFTSITNATNTVVFVTNTVTTFYQCLIACSSFSATSGLATASIVPTGTCNICGLQQIVSLPFAQNSTTHCAEGDDVTPTSVVNVCGNPIYYNGADAVYSFTPTASGAVTVGVNAATGSGSGLGVTIYQGCPMLGGGGTCSGFAQSVALTQTLCVTVTAGQIYYLIIDKTPFPSCFGSYNVDVSAPGACIGSIVGSISAATPSSGCGSVPTVLNLTGITACGLTYQWQSSSSLVGPYSNIGGATADSYSTTVTSTTFYQCLLTCGASTAASTVSQVSVTPPPVVPCSLSTYTSSTMPYSFETFVGTQLPGLDDRLSASVSFGGFSFCYGGSMYWGGFISDNGAFVFDAVPCFPNILTSSFAATNVSTGFALTNPAPSFSTSIPRNAVLAPWQALSTISGGTVQYYTAGVAPNRRFVISYESVPMTICTASLFTGQIKLFETSNAIEIHVGNKQVCSTYNNGEAVMGLHSFDGVIYIPPVNAIAHNAVGGAGPFNLWTMNNTAYKFESPCAVNGGVCVVLPINFKRFYGENKNGVNKLFWETAEEKGIKEFFIERSSDGINFDEIGAENSSNELSKYSFTDNTFKSNIINYYKITAVENSGARKSTNIISIGSTYDNLIVSEMYPNPTKDKFSITFSSKIESNFIIKIKDMYGREVENSNHTVNAGISQVILNCSEFNSGIYIVEVIDSYTRIISQQKLIISN